MLCLLRFGRIFRLIGRVMSLMFSALTLYEWGPFRRSWGRLGAVLGYVSSGASATIAVSMSAVPFSGWNLCQSLRWDIMPRMISMRWVCSVQPMSRKCSMLDLVETRFFSSVMLMVFMVLPFGVVLSFYLLLYTVWRWGANLFRWFLLSIFRVRQTEVSGVAIIATATTFATSGGRHKA